MYEQLVCKFEYKGMKTVQHPSKLRKYLSNVHKIVVAHLQCVGNHFAKFEYKGMKTVGVTDYTSQTPSKHFGRNMSKFNNLKMRKYSRNVHIIEGADRQYVTNHYAKFE